MNIFKNLFGPKADLKAIKEAGAVIIDVRTTGEYSTGHIPGSLNIPLDTLGSKIIELRNKKKPLITVCRSGARSGMAKAQLESAGLEVYNGGPWDSLIKQLA